MKPESTLHGNIERAGHGEGRGQCSQTITPAATITPGLESWKNLGANDGYANGIYPAEIANLGSVTPANGAQAQAAVAVELDSPDSIRDLVFKS